MPAAQSPGRRLSHDSVLATYGLTVGVRGYLPDLEPLLVDRPVVQRYTFSDDMAASFSRASALQPVARSHSSPQLSPTAPRRDHAGDGTSILRLPAALADDKAAPLLEPHEHARDAPAVDAATGVGGVGSRWGAVFNMCSSTLGAGALSLPYALSHCGLVLGVVLLVATALATYYSVFLLTAAMEATGKRSYESLTVLAFGRTMGVIVELQIIGFCFGTMIAYTIALSDIFAPVVLLPTVRHALPWLSRRALLCLLWAGLMLPLSLNERMSALQASSLFGILSLAYLVFSICVHAAWSVVSDEEPLLAEARLFNASSGTFSALAILMFAFTCQVNVPSIYAELTKPSLSEMSSVSARAVCICLLSYALVGTAGYVNFPHSEESNILSNYCMSRGSDLSTRLMAPAFLAISITVLMAYPLNVFPCRYTIDVMLVRRYGLPSEGSRLQTSRHTLLTTAITGAALLVALYVPGINVVFQLMGSTASALVCFVLPAAFAWRLPVPQVQSFAGRLASASLFTAGVAISIIATYVTIAQLLEPPPGSREV